MNAEVLKGTPVLTAQCGVAVGVVQVLCLFDETLETCRMVGTSRIITHLPLRHTAKLSDKTILDPARVPLGLFYARPLIIFSYEA